MHEETRQTQNDKQAGDSIADRLRPFVRLPGAIVFSADGRVRLWADPSMVGQARGRASDHVDPELSAILARLARDLEGKSSATLRQLTIAGEDIVCACRVIGNAEEGASYLVIVPVSTHHDQAVEEPAVLEEAVPEPVTVPMRFVWRSDADQRLTQISDELTRALGLRSDDLAGRSWGEVLDALIADDEGILTQALSARETFSALPTTIFGRTCILSAELSGLPLFDAERRFQGFRGFGLILSREERQDAPVVSEQSLSSSQSAPTVQAIPAKPIAPPSTAPVLPSRNDTPELDRAGSSANVSFAAGLSQSERNAFRDIARALGARIEGEEDPEPEEYKPDLSQQTTSSDTLENISQDIDSKPERQIVSSVELPEAQPVVPSRPVLVHDAVALRAKELIDRVPVGVLVCQDDEVLFANRTLLDLLDYDNPAAINARGGVGAIFKSDVSAMNEAAGITQSVLIARGGETMPADLRAQDLEWDGKPATMISIRRSNELELRQRITLLEQEIKNSSADLRDLRTVLDTATDGVVVIDDKGRILSMNRSCEALFGYDQKEVVGDLFSLLLSPESQISAIDYLEGMKAGGVRSVLNDGREVTGRVRQGGTIPLFMTIGMVGEQGSGKFCAVLRDLTPWKKAETDLVEARQAAEKASQQKSDFLAKISHEIRTPLNAIIGFAEVMMEERFGPIDNERYAEYLRDIHTSGGHVISLVNDLLDLSKVEAGKLELDFTSVNFNDVVRSCMPLVQTQAARGRIVMRSSLADKVPNVVADRRSLKQIVLNILSNAVKFTDAGGQVIVSTTLTDKGEVVLRVRDTGIGMSEKEIGEALEPFRQLATSRRAGGTGLGLPLTKALVEANRGSLRIASAKNEGTLVEVTFPPTRVLAE